MSAAFSRPNAKSRRFSALRLADGAAIVPRQINAESRLQAASPANDRTAVRGRPAGIETMRAFAWILSAHRCWRCHAFQRARGTTLYIAIMRPVGASRGRVAALLLLEAWLRLCWRSCPA
jgi:hypothetical protein